MRTEPSGVETIPISFNDKQWQFLLDTGGFFTQISSTVADELKLPRLASDVHLFAVNGNVSAQYTRVENFTLGRMRAASMDMVVSTMGFDGIFAPTSFKAYDFEMDFASGKLNILSNDHCEGKVIYWPAQAVAAVPITVAAGDNHIIVPVTVDGREFRAVIDTGSSTSTIRVNDAERAFDLTPGSPDMAVVGYLDSEKSAPIYAHAFKTLTFDGVTVTNPKIRILTDIVNKNADHSEQTGNRALSVSADLTLPQVIVGMDVLRKLHLYLAMRERRLYLTEAGNPQPAPAAQ